MKGNHAIPNNHFKKTAKRVKTRFAQPIRAEKRKTLRMLKSEKLYPCPLQKLRPIVRCATIKYNRKERLGRGFTPEECRTAELDYHYARTIGIAVDIRRRNQNEESFNKNVDRLREYVGKLKIFNTTDEASFSGALSHRGIIMPILKTKKSIDVVQVTEIASLE